MTNEEIDALESLLSSATPGPWESRPVSGHRTENEARYVCREWDPAPWWIANVLGGGGGPFSRSEGNANSDLIASLRNAAPAMLSRLRALEVSLRRTGMCGSCIDTNHVVLARGCCPCECGDGWGALDAALKEAGL